MDTNITESLAYDIWTRDVSGKHLGATWSGQLALIQTGTVLSLQARVKQPRVVTRTFIENLTGNTSGKFKVEIINFSYNIAQFNRTATTVSFSMFLGGEFLGRFTIYSGPVQADLRSPGRLAQDLKQYEDLLRAIGPNELSAMVGESVSF